MNQILSSYYCPEILEGEFRFSPSGVYRLPPDGSLDQVLVHIKKLPLNDAPEVFGLHDNANITSAIKESNLLLSTVLSLQPRTASGAGESRESVLQRMAEGVKAKIPVPYDIEACSAAYPVEYGESMNTVLVQELKRFNRLIEVISSSLSSLLRALVGEVVMSPTLEQLADAIYDGRIPPLWAAVSYGFRRARCSCLIDELLVRAAIPR